MYRFFFINWFAGTLFMFHFANFISMLRKHVRPGVFWFIRDMDDDTGADPVQEMLSRPLSVTLPKIFTSFAIYIMLAICIFMPLHIAVLFGVINFDLNLNPASSANITTTSSTSTTTSPANLEWTAAYWLFYLLLLRLLKKFNVNEVYNGFIKRIIYFCAWKFAIRSIIFGGVWDDDIHSEAGDDVYIEDQDDGYERQPVKYVDDNGDRLFDCDANESSFMLVLAQDKFIDIDGVKKLFSVDEPVPKRSLDYNLTVSAQPRRELMLLEPKPEETVPPVSFHIVRTSPPREIPVFSTLRSWRDPFRVKMSLTDYRRFISVRYGSKDVGLYSNQLYNIAFNDKERPNPPTVDIKLEQPGGTEIILKGTIVYKPKFLHRKVGKFIFSLLSLLIISHYCVLFASLYVGRFLIARVTHLFTGQSYKSSDYGNLIIGLSVSAIAVTALIVPLNRLIEFSRQCRKNRLLVYMEVKRLLRMGVPDIDTAISNIRLLVPHVYDLNQAKVLLEKYKDQPRNYKNLLKNDCNLGKLWFVPIYFNANPLDVGKGSLLSIFSFVYYTFRSCILILILALIVPVLFSTFFRHLVYGIISWAIILANSMKQGVGFMQILLEKNGLDGAGDEIFSLGATMDYSLIEVAVFDILNFSTAARQLFNLARHFPNEFGFFNPEIYNQTYVPLFEMRWTQVSMKATLKIALSMLFGILIIWSLPYVMYMFIKYGLLHVFWFLPALRHLNQLEDSELVILCEVITVPLILSVFGTFYMLKMSGKIMDYVKKRVMETECLVAREVTDLDEETRERMRKESSSSAPAATPAQVPVGGNEQEQEI